MSCFHGNQVLKESAEAGRIIENLKEKTDISAGIIMKNTEYYYRPLV